MAMTRKHYRRIADILTVEFANASSRAERLTVRNITYLLADIMKQDNPRFDRDRFYNAVFNGQDRFNV